MLAKPGDVVETLSGSLPMTVSERYAGGNCRCVWFTPEGKYDYGTFHESTLHLTNKRTKIKT